MAALSEGTGSAFSSHPYPRQPTERFAPRCRRLGRSEAEQLVIRGTKLPIPPFATKQKLAERRSLQSQRTGHPDTVL